MAQDISPEERLLRLIKGRNNGPDIKVPQPPARSAAEEKKEALALPPEVIKPRADKKFISARNLNYPYLASGFIIFLLVLFFVLSVFLSKDKNDLSSLEKMVSEISQKAAENSAQQEKPVTATGETKPAAKEASQGTSFEEYQKMLKNKTIFAPQAERSAQPSASGGALRDMTKDLKLVGIIPGEDPQAIIEDKKNGQTLFLRQGEQIDSIELRKISNGKIILGYGEETITLSM